MKKRAKIEGVSFELNQKEFFEPYFELGVRKFFGVTMDDNGFLISDEQVPKSHPNLLLNFIESNKSEN
jgi:hypothetical protein